MKNLEILAPVGNIESLRVAIAHGADAVYFGVPKFNARAKANNISFEDLQKAVERCHLFGIKVYLTLNTLIKNKEFQDVYETVKKCVDANVDAYIIQDFGLAKFLKKNFEGIVLHASTQMGIHNLAGARMLEKVGFSRVVLARETLLKDIKEIKNNTNLELEYFVQGALCVCFSGNCYMSSLLHSKSGNRGECLQLCRLKYSAVNNEISVKNGYLLSPKDLCLVSKLQTLIDAGVTSFKIEGRLRRPAYLAQAIDTYSTALKDTNFDIKNEKQKLAKVFKRGDYNEGEYLNCGKNIINPTFQNHRGVEIGEVVKCERFKDIHKITISTNHPISIGDGLKFVFEDTEQSMGVGNFQTDGKNYVVFSSANPQPKSKVYLTVDSQEEERLISFDRKKEIDIGVVARKEEPLKVVISDGEFTTTFVSSSVGQVAKNSPLTSEDLHAVFAKLGETEFVLRDFSCLTNNCFLPKSELNQIRRESIKDFQSKIIENNFPKKPIKISKKIIIETSEKTEDKSFVIVNSINNIKKIYSANNIIYYPFIYEKNDIINAVKTIKKYNSKKPFLFLPIINNYFDNKIFEDIFNSFSTDEIGFVANNYWALTLCEKGFEVIAGSGLNIINNTSVFALEKLGIKTFVRSIEDDLTTGLQGGIDFEGKPTLMTFVHCPFITCYEKDCASCQHKNKFFYVMENGHRFEIERHKVFSCQFNLKSDTLHKAKTYNKLLEITNESWR